MFLITAATAPVVRLQNSSPAIIDCAYMVYSQGLDVAAMRTE